MEDRDLEFSVVSGSNEEMLFGCLDSLHKTLKESAYSWSVAVTCNESEMGLAARVRARYPDATVMQSEKSSSVAASHNRVLRSSRARYVWLLSDDLLILPDTVNSVTEFMERPGSSRFGIVSPKLLNPDGSAQASTYSFPSMFQIIRSHSGFEFSITRGLGGFGAQYLGLKQATSRATANDSTVEVDTLCGACVAVRMKAVRQVGPMAEVAIAGAEEPEWHRRFKEQGWKVVYFPDASVIHYGSRTARDGSRNLYPDYLKGALYFFRTGRSQATYGLFCSALLGIFGARTAYSWLARDKSGVNSAKRYAEAVWRGLRGNNENQLNQSASS